MNRSKTQATSKSQTIFFSCDMQMMSGVLGIPEKQFVDVLNQWDLTEVCLYSCS